MPSFATWRRGQLLAVDGQACMRVQALSGDSTDCNCSKTSWSSSQGAVSEVDALCSEHQFGIVWAKVR